MPTQSQPGYRALRWMASAYAALAVVVALLATGSVVAMFNFLGQGNLVGAAAAAAALLVCAAGGITCFALSEALQVFLQIEQNTRATRVALTHRLLSDSGQ